MIDLLAHGAATASGLGGPSEMWAAIVADFSNIGEPAALAAFFQVLMIDLVLAGVRAGVPAAVAKMRSRSSRMCSAVPKLRELKAFLPPWQCPSWASRPAARHPRKSRSRNPARASSRR